MPARRFLHGLVGTCLFTAMLTSVACAPTRADSLAVQEIVGGKFTSDGFAYAFKVICGTPDMKSTTIAPGRQYMTEIGIHNPNASAVGVLYYNDKAELLRDFVVPGRSSLSLDCSLLNPDVPAGSFVLRIMSIYAVFQTTPSTAAQVNVLATYTAKD